MNKGKNNESGLTLAQRRERDAAALRAKQDAAAAKKGTQNGSVSYTHLRAHET